MITGWIYGVDNKTMFAAFGVDGLILFNTIAKTLQESKELAKRHYKEAYYRLRFNKIRIDIKLD